MSMFEPTPPTEPTWDPDAHLERVYQRGRRLRARRRIVAVAGGTLLALVLATVVATAVGRPDRGQRVLTAGSGRRSANAASPGRSPAGAGNSILGGSSPAAGTGTGVPAGSGGAGPNGVGSSMPNGAAGLGSTGGTGGGGGGGGSGGGGAQGTSGGGGGRGGAPTSVPRRQVANDTTTTAPIAAPTTTVGPGPTIVAPVARDCAPTELAYSTATDKSSYSLGETVSLNLVARNISGRTCAGPSNAGISASAMVRNSTGAQVFKSNPIGISCTASCAPPTLAPGQSASYGAGSWDSAGPAGTYRAVATRLGISGSAATFKVR